MNILDLVANVLVGLVVAIHLYIVWFEMFAWEKKGKKFFRNFSADLFKKTKVMAANQGLYNGFLVAGLLWTFFIDNVVWQTNVTLFFLACVIVAGIYGAATANKRILFVQAIPAVMAFGVVFVR